MRRRDMTTPEGRAGLRARLAKAERRVDEAPPNSPRKYQASVAVSGLRRMVEAGDMGTSDGLGA